MSRGNGRIKRVELQVVELSGADCTLSFPRSVNAPSVDEQSAL